MSSQSMVCASEIHILLLIEAIVVGARDGVFQEVDMLHPFELMSFLQDAIDLPKSRSFSSRSEFIHSLEHYIHCDRSEECRSYINDALMGNKIDSFVTPDKVSIL